MPSPLKRMISFPIYLVALRPDHKPLMLRGGGQTILPLFDELESAREFAMSQKADRGAVGGINSATMLLEWVEAVQENCNLVWWNARQQDETWLYDRPSPMPEFLGSLRQQAQSEGSAGLN